MLFGNLHSGFGGDFSGGAKHQAKLTQVYENFDPMCNRCLWKIIYIHEESPLGENKGT